METQKRKTGAIAGGVALIAFGLFLLIGQIFKQTFWETMWPLFPIAIGVVFYIIMFAGKKETAGFAIPATIITMIGLILFFQNLTGLWETWAYAWALIIVAVGLGIYIMSLYTGKESDRRSGIAVMRVGLILFVVFGAVMELIFQNFISNNLMQYLFPALMILIGLYLILRPRKKATTPIQPQQPQEHQEPPEPAP